MSTVVPNKSLVRATAEECLRTQYDHGLIGVHELTAAEAALTLGTEDYTVGYELEVCHDTFRELGFPKEPLSPNGRMSNKDMLTVDNKAYKAGFRVGTDELYELSSPPSTHPYAQYIMQLGVVCAGLIPRAPTGMVTEHISIGTRSDGSTSEYVDALRTIEMLGASTPVRLMQPIHADDPKKTYNCRGYYGVSKIIFHGVDGTGWTGNNKRCELRSLQYRSPEQLLLALDALYYLGRGMHADRESTARNIYRQYRAIYLEESRRINLPDSELLANVNPENIQVLRDYYEPFAELLGDARTSKPIRDAARTAILSTREELKMDSIWTPFENPDYLSIARRGHATPTYIQS